MVAVAAPAVEPRLECSQLELSWAQRGGKGGGMSLSSSGASVSEEILLHQGADLTAP